VSAQIGQGIALVARQRYEKALDVLRTVLQKHPQRAEAWFWHGLACVFAQRDAEALVALEHARTAEIPLSAVLFTPLRWTTAARPDFYQERLVPFLQDMEHHALRL
jgi:tetratricopeptide (TPR) repeat protein